MAISVMTWVWTHSRSRNGARLVLLAIADSANDSGRNAWPSIKTLKTKANLSERAVQSAIKDLVALGELKVEWNKGPHGSNWYSIIMKTPAESAPPQILHPADSAGVETKTNSDTTPQDPPQNLHPAESAPPQNLRETPAESAPEPSFNRPTSSQKTSSSSKKAAPTTRGTRIPDDFAMTDDMIAWGRKNFPHLDGETITAEFIDYWRSVPGAKGLKADWPATWRTWIRRTAERTSPAVSPHGRSNGGPRRATTDERLDQADAALIEAKKIIYGGAP